MLPRTVGQYRLRQIIPQDIEIPEKLDGKGSRALLEAVAQKYPEKFVDINQRFQDAARDAVTNYGRWTSLSIKDLKSPPAVKAKQEELRAQVRAIKEDPKLSSEEKQKRIVDMMTGQVSALQAFVTDEVAKSGSSLGLAAKHDFRGNPLQATQLFFGDIMVADQNDRPIPVASVHGYNQGVTPLEYLAGAYGARKGGWAVQDATAVGGYAAKQMSYMTHRQRVTGDDCGVGPGVGIRMKGDSSDALGGVLNQDVDGIPAGTILRKEHLAKLAGKDIIVRAVSTCQMKDGICKKCSGLREDGKLPTIGDYVGIVSARSVSEPATQKLALSFKHTGGVAGAKAAGLTGLPAMVQLLNVPERFQHGAVLAPVDGLVTDIRKAPQGGMYVSVSGSDEPLHVGEGVPLKIQLGDKVEAGDPLSDGTPNPEEIAKYKGIGEARRQYVELFGNVMKGGGVAAMRKHLDPLAAGFLNRVRLTNNRHLPEYDPGDVIPYSTLQAIYKPRPGAETVRPDNARGYLEKPILHYTIGTRVTPRVAAQIKEAGIKEIVVHPEAPEFEPHVTRAMDVLADDPDWETQLGGFNLHKSFIKTATTGGRSEGSSTSYVPALINPEKL